MKFEILEKATGAVVDTVDRPDLRSFVSYWNSQCDAGVCSYREASGRLASSEVYAAWARDNIPAGTSARLACRLLLRAFGELQLLQGRVVLRNRPYSRPHCWLRAPRGQLIDPSDEASRGEVLQYITTESPPVAAV